MTESDAAAKQRGLNSSSKRALRRNRVIVQGLNRSRTLARQSPVGRSVSCKGRDIQTKSLANLRDRKARRKVRVCTLKYRKLFLRVYNREERGTRSGSLVDFLSLFLFFFVAPFTLYLSSFSYSVPLVPERKHLSQKT